MYGSRFRVPSRQLASAGLMLLIVWILCGWIWAEEPGATQAAGGNRQPAAAEQADAGQAAAEQADPNSPNSPAPDQMSQADVVRSFAALFVGMAIVLGLIIGAKIHAFIALITAAIVVSLMAPGPWAEKLTRVATAFGSSAGSIGIVIALAAVIGKCMLDSGAADRVVRAFLNMLGERRAPAALMGSGFVLSVPVFFDTVFYLLVPLARSMYRRTGRQYLFYVSAIAAGGAITHTLIPPTPGPLVIADNLNFDVGWMIMIGSIVAIPSAIVGLLVARLLSHLMPVPMRPIGSEPEPEPLQDHQLPSLFFSLLPIILPVVLISTNTVLNTMADAERPALLNTQDIRDWEAWQEEIQQQLAAPESTPADRMLVTARESQAGTADERAEWIALLEQAEPWSAEQRAQLIEGLNQFVLTERGFHRGDVEVAFLDILPGPVARGLLARDRQRLRRVEVERLNRSLLESAYPDYVQQHTWETPARQAANFSAVFGNANLAMLLAAVIAILVLVRQRGLARRELAHVLEISLMSGGVIILITSAGGAFGAMLIAAEVGDAIRSLFEVEGTGAQHGIVFLALGFLTASVLKVAQGSGTVAMITGSAMMAGVASPEILGCHPVYLATCIGAGSLVGSWMNDSGFWIFAKMSGLTEVETLKSWTIVLIALGTVSFLVSLLLSRLMPLV